LIKITTKKDNKDVKKMNLKQILKNKLNESELQYLRTSYDIVGDIAIIEIPKELEKKEKIIGKALLDNVKSVNTVVKKVGIHKGKFRLQEHKVIAGKKTKRTLYKENGCIFEIDIDKTYFSTRSSTERKRIADLTKKGENVLVMFSGIAPFPLVISKNSDARYIYGIELNKEAHNLAKTNIKLNKANNIHLINADARKVREFYTMISGMKSNLSTKQFNNKYKMVKKYNSTPIIELYTDENDIVDFRLKKFKDIRKKAELLTMHQVKWDGSSDSVDEYITNLERTFKIIKDNKIYDDVNIIIAHLPKLQNNEYIEFCYKMRQFVKQNKDFFKEKVYFENMPWGYFANMKNHLKFMVDFKFKNFCYDVAHHFIALSDGENKIDYRKHAQQIIKFLTELDTKKYNLYFHIDNCAKINNKYNDQYKLNDSFVTKEFSPEYFQLITKGIVEVSNADENMPVELTESFEYLNKLNKKHPKTFDRIVMPLPKDAELFLGDALYASKKGTMIHLYHFSNIDEVKNFKKKLTDIASQNKRNIKILNVVRCGDYSPKVHRFCFDIKVL